MLTAKELANRAGVTVQAVNLARVKGRIVGSQVGGVWQYDEDQVKAFLNPRSGSYPELQHKLLVARVNRAEIQAELESVNAELARLEYEQTSALYSSKAEIKQQQKQVSAIITERFLRIPKDLSKAIAATTDPGVIFQLLDDRIRETLCEVAAIEIGDP